MAQIKLGKYELKNYPLPPLCMVCGQPATITRNKKFSWNPGWVYLLLLVGLLPCIIVALIMTRRMRIEAPLCDVHRNHWSTRNWVTGLSILGYVVFFFAALIFFQGEALGGLLGGSIALFVVWLIILAIWQATAIRVTEITNHSIVLQGVSRGFVNSVKEERAARDDEREQARSSSRQGGPDDKDRDYPDERRPMSEERRRYHDDDEDDD
jgi:hypothetical protein